MPAARSRTLSPFWRRLVAVVAALMVASFATASLPPAALATEPQATPSPEAGPAETSPPEDAEPAKGDKEKAVGPSPEERAETVIAAARRYLDYPYRLGTEGPASFDCSGLIFRSFADSGELALIGGARVRAANYMRWFAARGLMVAGEEEATRGDLVIYNNGSHIGVYLGDGRALSALTSGVAVHSLRGISLPVTSFLKVDWTGVGGNGPSAVPPTSSDIPEIPASLVPPLSWGPTLDAEAVAAMYADRLERADMRTASSRTFAEADGAFTTELFSHPIHYLPPDSTEWQPIDLRLAPATRPGTDLATVGSPAGLTLSAPDAAGNFLHIAAGEQAIGLAMPDAGARRGVGSAPLPSADGLYADYFDFLRDGTGLRVFPRADGFKAVLVLAEQPRSGSFTFALDAAGLTPAAELDGTIALRDEAGLTIGRITRPLLLDSSATDGDGGGIYIAAAAVALSTAEDGSPATLTVNVARRYLDEAVYPAYLDVSLVDFPSDELGSDATFASSRHPGANFNAYQRPESPTTAELWHGRRPGTRSDSEAFLQFEGMRDALGGVDIESASLAVFPYWQHEADASPTQVRRVAEPWSAGTLTWDSRPATDIDLGAVETAAGEWAEIDLTEHVVSVLAAETDDHGLMLHATGAGRDGWKRLVAQATLAEAAALEPRLVVRWSNLRPRPVSTPDALTWSSPAVAPAQTRFEVQLSTDGFESVVIESGVVKGDAGSATEWLVPAEIAESGTDYAWRVRVKYGRETGWSVWSERGRLVTPAPAPAIETGQMVETGPANLPGPGLL